MSTLIKPASVVVARDRLPPFGGIDPRTGFPSPSGSGADFGLLRYKKWGNYSKPCLNCHDPAQSLAVTRENLLKWARDDATPRLRSRGLLRWLLKNPGFSGQAVDNQLPWIKDTILRDEDVFEGGDFGGRNAAAAYFESQWSAFRPGLEKLLVDWYSGEIRAALDRTPMKDANLVLDPGELNDLARSPQRKRYILRRSEFVSEEVVSGKAFGNVIVEDVGSYGIYFKLKGHPDFVYSVSKQAFAMSDPLVAMVASDVAVNARFAGELFPFMFKMAGFGLGFHGRLAFVIAGAIIEAMGDEGLASVRNQPGRSPFDILMGIGTSVFVDRVLHNLSVPGPTHPLKVASTFDEKAADAIRRELADTEQATLSAAIEKGEIRGVTKPSDVAEGFRKEVPVNVDGAAHRYLEHASGVWCRESRRICKIPVKGRVGAASKPKPDPITNLRKNEREMLRHVRSYQGQHSARLTQAERRTLAGIRSRLEARRLTAARADAEFMALIRKAQARSGDYIEAVVKREGTHGLTQGATKQSKPLLKARDALKDQRKKLMANIQVQAKRLGLSIELKVLKLQLAAKTRRFTGENAKIFESLKQNLSNYVKKGSEMSGLSERLGVIAARDWAAKNDYKFLSEGKGSGTLDLVFWKPGPPRRVMVIEAKGGAGRQIPRSIDGKSYQQGAPEYLEWMLKNDATFLAAATEKGLVDAIHKGTIKPTYHMVSAPGGGADVRIVDFELNPAKVAKHRAASKR